MTAPYDVHGALARIRLFRSGIRSFTKDELQADVLALDHAIRAVHARSDEAAVAYAASITGDLSTLIADLQIVAHAAARVAHCPRWRRRFRDELRGLSDAVADYETKVGEHL